MKKIIIFSMMLTACGAMAPQASAQRFAIKGYDNIGLNKPMSITNVQPGQTSKSTYNSFGLDFGYTFWRRGAQSLEANIGVGYSFTTTTFTIGEMNYHYNAPASADMDGNPYVRYYQISNLRQKSTLGYFQVPIYLDYQYKPLSWLGIYAQVGFGLGFRVSGNTGDVSGSCFSYGVFPEYDDLLIDAPYLDEFGYRSLTQAKKGPQSMKGFLPSVMAGVGFEFYTYKPVSFVVGIRYNAGLGHAFSGKYDISSSSEYTAETAPVTYTVADGQVVKALSDYTTGSRLSPLSLHVGVNVRF